MVEQLTALQEPPMESSIAVSLMEQLASEQVLSHNVASFDGDIVGLHLHQCCLTMSPSKFVWPVSVVVSFIVGFPCICGVLTL